MILGITPSTSFILALIEALLATLVISGIWSSIFFFLPLYTSFLTTSFLLPHVVYLNQKEQVVVLSTSNLSAWLFKLLKINGTFFNWYPVYLH